MTFKAAILYQEYTETDKESGSKSSQTSKCVRIVEFGWERGSEYFITCPKQADTLPSQKLVIVVLQKGQMTFKLKS